MTAARHIVWVTPALSAEARSGGEIRTHRLVSALSPRVRVELVAVGARSSAEALKRSTGCDVVHTFPIEASGIRKRLRAVRQGWPLPSSGWWHPDAARLIDARSQAGDVVVLDHLWVAGYASGRVGDVLLLQNAEAKRIAEEPRPRALPRRIEAEWNVWAARRLERDALQRAGLVVVVSEHDRKLLDVEALIVPNGTDLPADPGSRPLGGDVLFVGSMDYPPNELAVRWWADAVWPHVSGRIPPLTVVGRSSSAVLTDLLDHPGVRIVGEVEDMAPYLRRASVVAVPLQHGGGTRLKVLEALAWERPVVCTTKGAEGLPLVHERHVLLVDEGRGFAEDVCRAYCDDAVAARLTAEGRRLAESFTWDAMAAPFVAAVVALCEKS